MACAGQKAEVTEHGARKAYQAGCRCLPCRSANAAYSACRRAKLREGRPILGSKQDGLETARQLRCLIGEGYSSGVLMALIGLRPWTFYAHTRTEAIKVYQSGRVDYKPPPRVTLRVAFKVQRFWRQQQVEGE